MNRNKRDVALQEIRNALIKLEVNIPNLEFLRKKIKTLKTVYRQELIKVEKSKKSGAGVEDIYLYRKTSCSLLAGKALLAGFSTL